MSCLIAPLVLNIYKDFSEDRFKSIIPEEVVTIVGITNDTSYSLIREKIIQILQYLHESNTLVIDLWELDEISFDSSAKYIGTAATSEKKFRKKIIIQVIAKEKFHRIIKKFGIIPLTKDEYFEILKTY